MKIEIWHKDGNIHKQSGDEKSPVVAELYENGQKKKSNGWEHLYIVEKSLDGIMSDLKFSTEIKTQEQIESEFNGYNQ